MNGAVEADGTLRTIASVLGWCLVFTIGALLLWLLMLVCAGDFIYRMHSGLFDITKNQMAVTHYAGMAFLPPSLFPPTSQVLT